MVMKKILFVVYQAPGGSIWVNEAFRTAFGMYGEDIEPSVLLVEEATVALSKKTQPECLGLLPISICFRFIKRYETEVYGIKEHVEKFKIKDIEESFSVKLIDEKDTGDFLHDFDNVIFI
jgi:tRNA 2-thiouridine synthesizing protein C